ncbi:hypothetical protein QNA23_10940 [Rhodococcus erythropolis]|uniref:hypothetical protein n=1 Tax=Rhodococcus erythropolis TaxID=1833 RepID=UPI0024B9382C|nr:hypothetical protein [Rhodococcus erythropolis]MDJ0403998.1 hypothetical protein [Rhodococcus erythropolis]
MWELLGLLIGIIMSIVSFTVTVCTLTLIVSLFLPDPSLFNWLIAKLVAVRHLRLDRPTLDEEYQP